MAVHYVHWLAPALLVFQTPLNEQSRLGSQLTRIDKLVAISVPANGEA